jgi:hypothetical protein
MKTNTLTDAELDRLVERFHDVAPGEIARFFPTPNNCIAAVRITEQVFEKLGVEVQPLACRFICGAPALHKAYVSAPRDPEWEKQFQEADWIDTRRDGWQGHLVAIAGSGRRWLIDSTWQAAGEFLGFDDDNLRCLAIPLPPKFDAEHHAIHCEAVTGNGLRLDIRYEPIEDTGYLAAPAWELDHLEPAIGMILRRMAGREPEAFYQFVIYRRPRDIPFASIMVRRWRLVEGRIVPDPEPCIVLAGPEEKALAYAREWLASKGLIRWERFLHDDPCIVEVWF